MVLGFGKNVYKVIKSFKPNVGVTLLIAANLSFKVTSYHHEIFVFPLYQICSRIQGSINL